MNLLRKTFVLDIPGITYVISMSHHIKFFWKFHVCIDLFGNFTFTQKSWFLHIYGTSFITITSFSVSTNLKKVICWNLISLLVIIEMKIGNKLDGDLVLAPYTLTNSQQIFRKYGCASGICSITIIFNFSNDLRTNLTLTSFGFWRSQIFFQGDKFWH